MKTIFLLLIVVLTISCKKNSSVEKNEDKTKPQIIEVPELQNIFDSSNVIGSILVFDLNKDKFYTNDINWARTGKLPASTFKIANSIIGIETGIVENENTLLKWNGEQRRLKMWEQDLTLEEAFHYSCVPCYQEVARGIGAERMSDYLVKLDYGIMKVDSTNIDTFWLEGESRINQFDQIDFLNRLYLSDLPVSERTQAMVKKMMVIEENDKYKISGKTGWSTQDGIDNGWFVGFMEFKAQVFFFATNLEPNKQFDMNHFPMIRKDLTLRALELIKIKVH